MWKLECYRIINSVAGWANGGEYATPSELLIAVSNYGYSLSYRATSPTGEQFPIEFVEDENDSEYVLPTLGKATKDWPQYCGDIRSASTFKALYQ